MSRNALQGKKFWIKEYQQDRAAVKVLGRGLNQGCLDYVFQSQMEMDK